MNKFNKTLVIACGPDHAGKTKLCEHIIEKYRFNYYHCGVQPDIKQYHEDVLNLVFNDIVKYDNNFVIDRLFLSEQVYGTIFRSGPVYDWKSFDKNILENCKKNNIKYTVITCLPPKSVVVDGHASRSVNGDEMFNTVDNVYDAYNNIYENNRDLKHFYKYDFTIDPDYTNLDSYLENL